MEHDTTPAKDAIKFLVDSELTASQAAVLLHLPHWRISDLAHLLGMSFARCAAIVRKLRTKDLITYDKTQTLHLQLTPKGEQLVNTFYKKLHGIS